MEVLRIKCCLPKCNVFKVYHAKLDAPVTDEDITAFETGIVIGDLHCLPAHLERLEKEGEPWAKVTICEGKFHQSKTNVFSARQTSCIFGKNSNRKSTVGHRFT